MSEKHSISISDRLYSDIKEYCHLNDLKVNLFVEELIRKSFNVEKFGEKPFSKTEDIKQDTVVEPRPIVDEYVKEIESVKFSEKMIEGMKSAEKQMAEIVEETPNIQEIQDAVDNIVFEKKPAIEEKPVTEEKPKKRKITRLN